MKRFLPSIVFVLFCVAVSFAQAPKGINYQGVARDSEGNPLASKPISVRISILKTPDAVEPEYSETHKRTTNQFGLFTLIIGQGTKGTGDFGFISWAVGNKWLKIEVDPNGGVVYTLLGTQQLMSVPYALYAEYTGGIGLSAGQGITINSGVVINTGDADKDPTNELQTLAEVLTKSSNAGTIKINNLGEPLAANDAATKNYVDTQNALQNLADILTKGNDAGSRQIKNLGAPTDASDAATKNYVDALNALDLDTDPTNELQDLSHVLSRGTDAGGRKITNMGVPTAASDAVTKSYVDAENNLDLDKSATNEIQDLALNTTTNILNITNNTSATPLNLTPYKQTLTYTPATNNLAISGGNNVTISSTLTQVLTNSGAAGAGGQRIQSVGAPSADTDATTKLYVDNAIATNYAFKVPYSFTNAGTLVVNQVVGLGADIYDDFNVVASNRFVTPSTGTYMFYIDGILNNAGINLELRVNSTTIYPIKKQEWRDSFGTVNFNNSVSLMLKLTKDEFVEIFITSSSITNTVTGTFFGYKL